MLVYGDPQFEIQGRCLRSHLKSLLGQPEQGTGAVDFWRMVLIQLGQMEQGFADLPATPLNLWLAHQAEHLTDLAAERFYTQWAGIGTTRSEDLARHLKFLEAAEDLTLRIKVPEGYEFYALFPEQYLVSALAWAKQNAHATSRDVLVVGIRSIGTSLSAIVATALGNVGWNVRRITVRPKGHPFQRELTLQSRELGNSAFALIVDEGPGMSGSSMAAVAEALTDGGLSRTKVAFFPGHGNEPGSAASERVREWWRTIPRFFTPWESLSWNGKTLKNLLLSRSRCFLCPESERGTEPEMTLQDITAGGWLPVIYRDPRDWPPVFWPFERLKFRCISSDGRALLWKFTGLGALLQTPRGENSKNTWRGQEDAPRKSAVKTLPIIGTSHGFSCTEWINGSALSPALADTHVLQAIARYLAQSALAPLSEEQIVEALDRLRSMLLCNTNEQFGSDAARRAEQIAGWTEMEAARLHLGSMPSCADGRMGPQEWLQMADGCLVKTDSTANLVDHTLVGRQPLVWDIAGVITEWRLNTEQSVLFQQMVRAQGLAWKAEWLNFYLATYAAFKMGQSAICLQIGSPDAGTMQRLHQAFEYYSLRLKAELYRDAAQSFSESTRGP